MFPIIASQLLSLPEGASTQASQRLPWSNGSLLSAKLAPSDSPGMAQVILGAYRLVAKVPPSTPMGDIWLQLVNRDMPAQFRLLNSTQVETELAKMLQKAASHSPEPKATKATQNAEQGWGKLDTSSLPFAAEVAAHGNFLMVRDRESRHRDVLLSSTVDGDQFRLLGRVDLEQLGSVAFNLQGGDSRDWHLKLFSINPQLLSYLRAHFNIWLEDEQATHKNLDGEVIYGMPENMATLARGVRA